MQTFQTSPVAVEATARVTDIDGRPLPQAFAELVLSSGASFGNPSDAEGFADLGVLPAQTPFRVRASLEGYRPAAQAPSSRSVDGVLPSVESSLPVAPGPARDGAAREGGGRRKARFEVVLEPFAPVRGRVVDADGRPITRFKLNGRWTDSPTGRFAYAYPWPDFQPSNIGFELALDGVPPALQSVPAGTTDVGDVVLAPHQPLVVTVLDEGGAPVQGALVLQTNPVRNLATQASPETDGSGRVLLGMVPRSIEATVLMPGFEFAKVKLSPPTAVVRLQRARGPTAP